MISAKFDFLITENARAANHPSLTYKYSEFTQAVKEGNVEKVVIFIDAGAAVVELNDGKKAKVSLAPDSDLFDLLQRNNVDVRVGSS